MKYFKKKSPLELEIVLGTLKVGFILSIMNGKETNVYFQNKQKQFLLDYSLKIGLIWRILAKKVLINWLIRLEMALADWLLKDATLLTTTNQRSRK